MRLLKHVVANKARRVRRLLNKTELWFVPVANPDGYDFTFTEGNRLWRKNLRDNERRRPDHHRRRRRPQPQLPVELGTTTRRAPPPSRAARPTAAPAPASEPETKAMDGLLKRRQLRDTAQLPLLRPAAALPGRLAGRHRDGGRPDLRGDDRQRRPSPAVPGFDPDLAAELYTTNGDTNDHAHRKYGTLSWTPELNEGCEGCGFVFPDDEALVQAEFEKNLPFALDIAKSAVNPVRAGQPPGQQRPPTSSSTPSSSARQGPGRPGQRQAQARPRAAQLPDQQRPDEDRDRPRSGRAASGTATATTTTTTRCAARSPAPSRATRSRSGSPRSARRARSSPTRWPPTSAARCWCWPPRTSRASARRRA